MEKRAPIQMLSCPIQAFIQSDAVTAASSSLSGPKWLATAGGKLVLSTACLKGKRNKRLFFLCRVVAIS